MTPFVLVNQKVRQRVMNAIRSAPDGWRVTIDEPKRSEDQAKRFWAALRQFAAEADHFGEKFPAETWRDIFMNALGRETRMVRALDGNGIIPVRISTKALSKREMSDLIELLQSECARRGIVLREPLPRHLRQNDEAA